LARGQHFNHKNKNHPGEFPQHAMIDQKKTEEAPGDEELIVTQEAFKNRMEEEEVRQDTGRVLPEQTE
jgi:hypothetical protein